MNFCFFISFCSESGPISFMIFLVSLGLCFGVGLEEMVFLFDAMMWMGKKWMKLVGVEG